MRRSKFAAGRNDPPIFRIYADDNLMWATRYSDGWTVYQRQNNKSLPHIVLEHSTEKRVVEFIKDYEGS